MQIGVVGINHKQAPLALRETIAKCCQRRFSLQNPLDSGSFVLLSTCNRCELYFSSDDLALVHEEILQILRSEIQDDFEQKLYTFFGFDCFLHLAKVTAGLDSAIIAETEIQGQVKTAYEQATSNRDVSKDLHFLFQKSLKIGKEVRSCVNISREVPDLEQALYWYATDYFVDSSKRALFIGASEINLKIARYFKQRGLEKMTFCNRTESALDAIHEELGVNRLAWQDLPLFWQEYDWIIAACKSPHYLLSQPVEDQQKKRLFVDLAVPRNIDPRLESSSVKVLNIDDLNLMLEERKACLAQKVLDAENTLYHAVRRQIALFRTRSQPLPMAIP